MAKITEDIGAKAKWLYGDNRFRNCLKASFTDGTFAMVCYRAMQFCNRRRLGILTMMFNKVNSIFCQCVIGRGANFGRRFVLVHSQGVVINGSVQGGDDIFVEHQVTIGAEKGKAPTLGNRIFIGAGAKVIGAIKIADDVKVGANAVVLSDAEQGATMVGVPARPVKQPSNADN